MKSAKFYDIHCHAINMSHPCLLAFARRCLKSLKEISFSAMKGAFKNIASSRIYNEVLNMTFSMRETQNLLSAMENDAGSLFLLQENCLLGNYGFKPPLIQNNVMTVAGAKYSGMVLTPLIMDFGYQASEIPGIYYNKPAAKPVNEQIADLLNGIKKYCEKSEVNFFEIYPFIGINTKNYTANKISEILNKYFGEYEGKYSDLKSNMGKFNGDIKNTGSNFFAGIKLYPPLGFDPWPENDMDELKKLELLYSYCCEKNIPVTTHCDDEGFLVCDENEALAYTSPERFEGALKNFPELKLNIAHFGRRTGRPISEWTSKICELMLRYKKVYTDFSFNGAIDGYYEHLGNFINTANIELKERIYKKLLFGTDFLINLLKIESYSHYIDKFSQTPFLPENLKANSACKNPEKFLFS